MQGIFSRRLRKRSDANTLTNGQTDKQTDKQTHRQNIMRRQKWHGHRNSEKYLDVAIVLFAYYYCKVILECQTGDNNFLQVFPFFFHFDFRRRGLFCFVNNVQRKMGRKKLN